MEVASIIDLHNAVYQARPHSRKFDRRTSLLGGRWQNSDVGSNGDYCAFTKAVEHLGDRWSLVIIRELLLHTSAPGFSRCAAADQKSIR